MKKFAAIIVVLCTVCSLFLPVLAGGTDTTVSGFYNIGALSGVTVTAKAQYRTCESVFTDIDGDGMNEEIFADSDMFTVICTNAVVGAYYGFSLVEAGKSLTSGTDFYYAGQVTATSSVLVYNVLPMLPGEGMDFVLYISCSDESVATVAVPISYTTGAEIVSGRGILEDIFVTPSASVTVKNGNWSAGTNVFNVRSDVVCAAYVSYDSGASFVKLDAVKNSSSGYDFTVHNVTKTTVIRVTEFGDVNGDGLFTNGDITRLKAAILGKITLNPQELASADATGDGRVTNADVTRMKAVYVGKIDFYW